MRISSYSVYDLKINECLGTSLNSDQVSELIGLYANNVSKYCRENLIYRKRYIIENSEPEKIPNEIKDEWDKYRLLINPGAKR